MSDKGSNRPRSALADGAERLALLARTVREQQAGEAHAAVRFSDVYSMSPDEAWSKKYMSQGIGPTPDCAAPGGYCPMPFGQVEPATKPAMARAAPPISTAGGLAQIGQAIGKPYKKRSLLGRMLRGSP